VPGQRDLSLQQCSIQLAHLFHRYPKLLLFVCKCLLKDSLLLFYFK
jgi:hypothetical protein